MRRAAAEAVSRAKTGSGGARPGQAQELLAPGALQWERYGWDSFGNQSAGYLRMAAKIVQVPLRAGGDAGVVSQAGAQAARTVSAAQVNVHAGGEIKGAQPANRQVSRPRQG
jgi:hypothetical protein